MTAKPRDPLLRITRLLLWIVRIAMAIGAAGAAIAIPVVWMFRSEIAAEMARQSNHPVGSGMPGALTALLVAAIVVLALSWRFQGKLIAVIDTVGEGSPFIPENAQRLRAMAWIALLIQAVALIVAPLAGWIKHMVRHVDVQLGLSFGGLLTALLLFILARVFDRGIQLEQDIEGTV